MIGREVVEVQQAGKARAAYGDRLVRALARRLTAQYGRGFSYASIKRMKQFYVAFPRGSAIPGASDPEKGSTLLSLSGRSDNGTTSLALHATSASDSRHRRWGSFCARTRTTPW